MHKFKHNTDPELQQIWSDSSHRHIVVDSFLNEDVSANSALLSLQEQQELAAQTHFYSLNTQGWIVKSVTETISRRNIVGLVLITGNNASIHLLFRPESYSSTTSDSIQFAQMEENWQSGLHLVQYEQGAIKQACAF